LFITEKVKTMNQIQFSAALQSHSSQLISHALRFTGDEDDAKDLVQETLIKGIRFAEKFAEGTNLKGWLFVIMRNTYINSYYKQAKRNAIFTVEEELSSPQLLTTASRNQGESVFAMEDISKAMASIKPSYRIAFQKYFEGYRYEEIAEEMQLPLGTVKTYIYQARLGLKKYLRKDRSEY